MKDRVEQLHRGATVVNGLALASDLSVLVDTMSRGGVSAANWTVPGPGGLMSTDLAGTVRSIAGIRSSMEGMSGRAILIETPTDLRRIRDEGIVGVILGFQDSLPIEGRVELIGVFQKLGIRVIQLTYQRRNLVGDGCGEPVDSGLSAFGRDVVAELNHVGVVIDLSHTGPRTSLDAIEVSADPCCFTHAGVAALNDHPRNKSDEAIRALAGGGGVMGILSISGYLRAGGGTEGTGIDDVIDHVAYVADLVGVDHVGLGLDIVEGMTESEFDHELMDSLFVEFPELLGSGGDTWANYRPAGLRSMADCRVITERLLHRGFTDEEVAKVLGHNFVRVFQQVWSEEAR